MEQLSRLRCLMRWLEGTRRDRFRAECSKYEVYVRLSSATHQRQGSGQVRRAWNPTVTTSVLSAALSLSCCLLTDVLFSPSPLRDKDPRSRRATGQNKIPVIIKSGRRADLDRRGRAVCPAGMRHYSSERFTVYNEAVERSRQPGATPVKLETHSQPGLGGQGVNVEEEDDDDDDYDDDKDDHDHDIDDEHDDDDDDVTIK
ncbi:hypothetical protein RRG08_066250 [Elysia crispata]|uniref:Uncharacterized protein n=1 Tax=Elysia crispata TaxID=231223 RepID=A0AAE1EDU7_9GAST|nr:hypothetical protein RRG08_066250 [Elysia crispata]